MKTLSIAHVLTSFGMGGGERVALDLARLQVRDGHCVFAVSLSNDPQGPLANGFRDAGATVVNMPKRNGLDAGLSPRLGKWIWQNRVQVIHTHNPLPLIYAAPVGKAVGCRVIHTKHGTNVSAHSALPLMKISALAVDVFVAVSEATAKSAVDYHECNQKKLKVIENGIDLDRFTHVKECNKRIRAEFGIPEDAWVVGSVGRVVEEKNHSLLLSAMATELSRDCYLVIVGDGPLYSSLVKERDALPTKQYVLLPGQRHDVPDILGMLNTFVISSNTEGLPLVLLEAMACGVPIISTSVGGIPAVLGDSFGVLVPASEVLPLREKIRQLRNDPVHAQMLADRAKKYVFDRYSAVRMHREYLSIYTNDFVSH